MALPDERSSGRAFILYLLAYERVGLVMKYHRKIIFNRIVYNWKNLDLLIDVARFSNQKVFYRQIFKFCIAFIFNHFLFF